jgi:hypothetical protein
VSRYLWLSDRRYKLGAVRVDLTPLIGHLLDAIEVMSFRNFSFAKNDKSREQLMSTLRGLHLLECNPWVKKLALVDSAKEISSDRSNRLFHYLSKRCPEVREIILRSASEETIRLAMDSFPKLETIECNSSTGTLDNSYIKKLRSYPKIETLLLHASSDEGHAALVPLIKSCPNLKALDCRGSWVCHGLPEILVSCNKLTRLIMSGTDIINDHIASILPAIAEYGLQLQEFSMVCNAVVDVRRYSIARYDLIRIARRVRCFELWLKNCISDDDPRSTICSMFRSPGVNLQSVGIDSGRESADMIAMMLQSCRNTTELNIHGHVDISPVMMKISASCHQLVDLELHYDGLADGTAMKAFLQACHQLISLIFVQLSIYNLSRIWYCMEGISPS